MFWSKQCNTSKSAYKLIVNNILRKYITPICIESLVNSGKYIPSYISEVPCIVFLQNRRVSDIIGENEVIMYLKSQLEDLATPPPSDEYHPRTPATNIPEDRNYMSQDQKISSLIVNQPTMSKLPEKYFGVDQTETKHLKAMLYDNEKSIKKGDKKSLCKTSGPTRMGVRPDVLDLVRLDPQGKPIVENEKKRRK